MSINSIDTTEVGSVESYRKLRKIWIWGLRESGPHLERQCSEPSFQKVRTYILIDCALVDDDSDFQSGENFDLHYLRT